MRGPKLQITYSGLWIAALRLGGLFIMVQQALSSQTTEKPVISLAALAMMGVSITVPADKKRRDKKDDESEDE